MNLCSTCGRTWSDEVGFCGINGQPVAPVHDELVGQTVGPYRIDALIGRGGIASVYRAMRLPNPDPVALKLLRRERTASGELVGRFKREMKAVGQLSHPNIAQLLDSGMDAWHGWYFVLPLLKGENLLERVERTGPQSWPHADTIARQTASALAFAHRQHIIHRDIKAENLHVAEKPDGQLHVQLLDFGLAKVMRKLADDGKPDSDVVRTRTGQIMGSPPCMAPEQVLSMPVDVCSDLYSFGVVLFELLTGTLPFDADTGYELLRMHVHVAPPKPSSKPGGRWLPPAVDDVVLALLQKRPSQRLQTAEAFLERWDAAAGDAARAWRAYVAQTAQFDTVLHVD
jgi:serine/threonine-protein kinase